MGIAFASGILVGIIINYFYELFSNKCQHNWKLEQQGNIVDENRDAVGSYKVYQCDKCLDIKKLKY